MLASLRKPKVRLRGTLSTCAAVPVPLSVLVLVFVLAAGPEDAVLAAPPLYVAMPPCQSLDEASVVLGWL